jgi:uncharacterized protein
MPRPPLDPSAAPLTDAEIDAFGALIDDLAERTEAGLSLDHVDGFITALICAPRLILPSEYFPVLFGDQGMAIFRDLDEAQVFTTLYQRRWNEIAHALSAPIDSLDDPAALEPLIMDWEGMLDDVADDERARIEAVGVPHYASVWAAGFLQVVDEWGEDWALPPDSKDEAFVDEMLEPFFVLISPLDELTPEEAAISRDEYVAMAIWSAYELRDFWRDRGSVGSRTPHRKPEKPGRNDLCPCGSGQKFKKCCGAADKLH